LVIGFLAACNGATTNGGDASIDGATDAAKSDGSSADSSADTSTDSSSSDARKDAAICPPCAPQYECCEVMGASAYGTCYPSACLSCCMF
jgi:hypothetical protein